MVSHCLSCGVALRWLSLLFLGRAVSVGCGGLLGWNGWACCDEACDGLGRHGAFSSGKVARWGRGFGAGVPWRFCPLPSGTLWRNGFRACVMAFGGCFLCGQFLWRGGWRRASWQRRWRGGKRESGKTACVLPDSTEIIVSLENRHLTLSARLTAFPCIRVSMLSNILTTLNYQLTKNLVSC